MKCVIETLVSCTHGWKVVLLLNSTAVCVCMCVEKERERSCSSPPPKACISSQDHSICPVTSQRADCPPFTGNFSEKWPCGLCSSPLDSGLYINSWEDRSSSEHFFLFVLSFSSPPLSLSCLTCGEQGDRSTIHVPVESPVPFCQSGSLSPWRGPQQTTVLPCCLSKSSFY